MRHWGPTLRAPIQTSVKHVLQGNSVLGDNRGGEKVFGTKDNMAVFSSQIFGSVGTVRPVC